MYVDEKLVNELPTSIDRLSIFMVLPGDHRVEITDDERARAPLMPRGPWAKENDPWKRDSVGQEASSSSVQPSIPTKPEADPSQAVAKIGRAFAGISRFHNIAPASRQKGATRKVQPPRSESAPPPAAKRPASEPPSPASSVFPASLAGKPLVPTDLRGLPLDSQDPDEEARERQLRESMEDDSQKISRGLWPLAV